MRCRQCDHVLWNQPAPAEPSARVCSECGAPYQPSDFSFERGKVRFCCPGCDTAYYGTSREGHLEPAIFSCVQCARTITMNECVGRPHDERAEAFAMQRVDVPWISSGTDGIVKRWWLTAKLGFTDSKRLVPLLVRPPEPRRAAGFLLINLAICGVVGFAFPAIVALAFGGFGGAPRFSGFGAGSAWGAVSGVAMMAGIALATVLLTGLPALFVSFLKRKGQPLGFGRAYELVAYSSGALAVVGLVPCCGPTLGLLWWGLQSIQVMGRTFESESIKVQIIAISLTIAGYFVATVAVATALRLT